MNYYKKFWRPVFDGDGSGDPPPNPPPNTPVNPPVNPPANPPANPSPKTFTEAEFNAKLDRERQKHIKVIDTTKQELEILKERSNLTAQEKLDLESRWEAANNELLTEKEQAAREKKKAESKYQTDTALLTSDRDHWKNLYEKTTIENSILSAASVTPNEAYVPAQLVALLSPVTTLVQELDEEGKPNGSYVPKVKFNDVDSKTGKPVQLTLNVSEAVKRMKELPDYQNLFKGGIGGVNGNTRPNAKGSDLTTLAKTDPDAYIKGRKSGAIKY